MNQTKPNSTDVLRKQVRYIDSGGGTATSRCDLGELDR